MVHSITGSNSEKPDLDWSQVRETISMLTLAVAQIEATMTDGEKSVSELSESFTYIANKVSELVEDGNKLDKEQETNSNTVNKIQTNACDINQKVNGAVIAFQFYDRLTQRIHHIKSNLDKLGALIGDSSQLYNPESWRSLQKEICSNYTMEEERIMFQHIMQGATVEQAIEIYNHHFNNPKNDSDSEDSDEIELF